MKLITQLSVLSLSVIPIMALGAVSTIFSNTHATFSSVNGIYKARVNENISSVGKLHCINESGGEADIYKLITVKPGQPYRCTLSHRQNESEIVVRLVSDKDPDAFCDVMMRHHYVQFRQGNDELCRQLGFRLDNWGNIDYNRPSLSPRAKARL